MGKGREVSSRTDSNSANAVKVVRALRLHRVRRWGHLFVICLAVLVLAVLHIAVSDAKTPTPASAPSTTRASLSANLTTIRISSHESLTRVMVSLSAPADFRTLTLAHPDRLIIDLSDGRWRVPATSLPRLPEPLTGFHHGQFRPDTYRLVFQADRPLRVVTSELISVPGNGYRLLVDAAQTSHSVNAAVAHVAKDGSTDVRSNSPSLEDSPVPRPKPGESENDHAAGSSNVAPAVIGATALPTADIGGTRRTNNEDFAVTPVAAAGVAPLAIGMAPAKNLIPSFSSPVSRPKRGHPSVVKYVVAIDPGHGGADPGAISPSGMFEKNITLRFARKLRQELESLRQYRVFLTRTRDVFIPLRQRIAIARKADADLFISIHANIASDPSTRGLSVYTLSERASDAEAQALAELENSADKIAGMNIGHQPADVRNILIDLAQRETKNSSSNMAALLVRQLQNEIVLLPRSHRFAGFAVLKAPDMPSVLIELGYLSNPTEERLLPSDRYQRKLARTIAAAVDAYFHRLDIQARRVDAQAMP